MCKKNYLFFKLIKRKFKISIYPIEKFEIENVVTIFGYIDQTYWLSIRRLG